MEGGANDVGSLDELHQMYAQTKEQVPDVQLFERSELSIVSALESFEAYLLSLRELLKNAKNLNYQLETFYVKDGGRFGGILDVYTKSNAAFLPLIEKEVKEVEQAFEGTRKKYKAVTTSFKERFVVRTAVEKQYKSVEQSYKKALKKSLPDAHAKKKEAYQKIKKLTDNFNQDFVNDLETFTIQKQDPFDPTLIAFIGMQDNLAQVFAQQSSKAHSTLKHIKDATKNNDKGSENLSTMHFRSFLKNQICLQYFRLFLQSEHSEENLNFWTEAEKYKKMSEESMKPRAKEIFETYLKTGAKVEINVSATTKTKIAKLMDSPDYTPDESTFRAATKEIFNLMETDSFDRFKNGEYFKKLQKRFQTKDFTSFERPTELEQLLSDMKKIKVNDGDVPSGDVGWVYTHSIDDQSVDGSKKKYALVRSKSFSNIKKTPALEKENATTTTQEPSKSPLGGLVKKLSHSTSTRSISLLAKAAKVDSKTETKSPETKTESKSPEAKPMSPVTSNESQTPLSKNSSNVTDPSSPRAVSSDTSAKESDSESVASTQSSPASSKKSDKDKKKTSFIWKLLGRKDKKDKKKTPSTPENNGKKEESSSKFRRETADNIKTGDSLMNNKEKEDAQRGRSSTVATPNQTPDAPRRPISPQSSLSSMPAEVLKDTPLTKESPSTPRKKKTEPESETEGIPPIIDSPPEKVKKSSSDDSSDTVSEMELPEPKPKKKKEKSLKSNHPNGSTNGFASETEKQLSDLDEGLKKFKEEQKKLEDEAKAKALQREQRRKQRELELQKQQEQDNERVQKEKERRKQAALERQKELEEAEKRAAEASSKILQALK